MMKNKKLLTIILTSIFFVTAAVVVPIAVVYGGKKPNHVHDFASDYTLTKAATCTEDGEKTRTCKDCGYEQKVTVPKTGHDFSGAYVQTETHHYKLCKNGCGEKEEYEEHNYIGGGEIIHNASCTEAGEKKFVCEDCGYENIVQIPETGHDFSDPYIITQTGHYRLCKNGCKAKQEDEEHKFSGGGSVCEVCLFDKGSADILNLQLNSDNSSYSVAGFKDGEFSSEIAIPDTYNGFPVTTISENAFNVNLIRGSLTSVKLGRNVRDIEFQAFWGNSELVSIEFPNSLRTVEQWAFSSCSNLKNVDFGNGVESFGYGAFMGCKLPEMVVFPSSLKSVGEWAFQGCTEIKHAIFPNVEYISQGIFYNCESLESVEVDGYAEIADWGLYYIPNVTSIKVGEKVIKAGNGAFSYCYMLEKFELCGSPERIGEDAFVYCTRLKEVIFHGSPKRIGANAFKDSNLINKVVVDRIEDWLNIYFETTETDYSQMHNRGSANPLSFGGDLIVGGSVVEDVEVPEGVELISPFAFINYSKLKSINISKTVRDIGVVAFYNTPALKTITVDPNNNYLYAVNNSVVTRGDRRLVASCSGTIPEGTKIITECVFADWDFGYSEIVIPDSVEIIRSYGFGRVNLKYLTIGSGLRRIERGGFSATLGATIRIKSLAAWCAVEMEDESCTPIKWTNYVFVEGQSVSDKRLTIPSEVRVIKPWVFTDFEISELYLPKETIQIDPTSFYHVCNIGLIEVEPGNEFYRTEKDGRILMNGTTLVIGTRGTALDLSDVNITTIGSRSFSGRKLGGISFPSTLEKIESYAFENSSTPVINFNEGLKEIGTYAFKGNKEVVSLVIPSSVVKIERNAFWTDEKLETVQFNDPYNWQEISGENITEVPEFADPHIAAERFKAFHETFVKNED